MAKSKPDINTASVASAEGQARSVTGNAAPAVGQGVDPALFFARVPAEDCNALPPGALAVLAARLGALQARRQPGEALVVVEPLAPLIGMPGTAVCVINDNMPFLLDSTLAALVERNLDVRLVAHPILAIERDGTGALIRQIGVSDGPEIAPILRESVLHLHVSETLDAPAQAALAAELARVYADIRASVRDWQPMRRALAEQAAALRASPPAGVEAAEIDEGVALIDWLLADHFLLLGVRDYTHDTAGKVTLGAGLGLLADSAYDVVQQGDAWVAVTPEIATLMAVPGVVFVTKANARARVHRRAYLDLVGLKRFNEAGQVVGERRVVGLFTATAYTDGVRHVPYLRRKIDRVFARAGFDAASHSGKALMHVLETYPRDEAFQVEEDTLYAFALEILALTERPRLKVLPRIGGNGRFVSVLVYVPKDRYDKQVRLRVGAYLAEAFGGRVSAAYPAYPEGALTRTHYIIGRAGGDVPAINPQVLTHAIARIIQRWEDGFAEAVQAARAARRLTLDEAVVARYAVAFSAAYREAFTPQAAVVDMARLEALGPHAPFAFDFMPQAGGRVELKIYGTGVPLSLSQRVPVLETLGFTVIEERAYTLPCADQNAWLHDMVLEPVVPLALEWSALEPLLIEALSGIFTGALESDRFNLLIPQVGVSVREAGLLRAYAHYWRQIGLPYPQATIAEALARNAPTTRLLLALFAQRFDPAQAETKAEAEAKTSALRAKVLAAINGIASQEEDRIFRKLLTLIEASVRVNAYQRGADGQPRPALAIKFACHAIEDLPRPCPLYEIFVSSPRVEGVHLRFGKVARGGLRWSDRPLDYRTEVLGLVKAQQVKNAVIVPVGAKGGFFPKRLPPPTQREAWLAEGTEAYKLFVSALLDLTDNLVEGQLVPPAATVRHDDDDPYLVVAADKGTATFSDTANALSQARGHWLGDAFASGGSVGYDHKKMGITARGAWEAVKRHFREMDTDIQTTPFTVVGVGDMSGDVFGNGMLLSPVIRLVAAFDHRDIFLDPTPDVAASFAERARLFALPRSSWADYDAGLISQGGGVFSRALKTIPVSAQAAAALGIAPGALSPQALMQAILAAPVDLLWFGGIGTYIGAQGESEAQIGDRANDAIRLTADQLRVKVIGEGANLGLSQAGRVAAGLAGVRLNTDAIDNSGGVNSSDLEVNIKIALGAAEASGRLDRPARNRLLEGMTEDVAQLVLRNNYLQPLALSLAQAQGEGGNAAFTQLMQGLEAEGRLDRGLEGLPSDAALAARKGGLTRPELAVLLAYAKLALFDALIASDAPDDPYLGQMLARYFPPAMRQAYADDIAGHRLRREIIATQLSNALINRGGPTLVPVLGARSRQGAAAIARAYALAWEGFGFAALFGALDALDNQISGQAQLALYAKAQARLIATMAWLLRHVRFDAGLEAELARFAPAFAVFSPDLSHQAGVEAALIQAAGFVPALDAVLIAQQTRLSFARAQAQLADLTEALGLADLRGAMAGFAPADPFELLAAERALARIEACLRALVVAQAQGAQTGSVSTGHAGTSLMMRDLRARLAPYAEAPLSAARLTLLAEELATAAR